jgi:CubicO group peptidase (beta-lactamase class C family)
LYGAMQATHQARHALEGKPGQSVALGWHVLEQNGSRIVWHNGGTAGYRTYIGFDEVTRRGVVLMSNSHMGSDDIARRALNSAFQLKISKTRRADLAERRNRPCMRQRGARMADQPCVSRPAPAAVISSGTGH